jgi:hypothetical protein
VNFWQFLDKTMDRLPGWPNGRGLVGLATFSLTVLVLFMVQSDESLRQDEFFKVIATAIVLTGFINGVVAFFYSQNQLNAEASANSRVAFEAMGKQAEATRVAATTVPQPTTVSAGFAADQVAEAAQDKADEIKGDDNA